MNRMPAFLKDRKPGPPGLRMVLTLPFLAHEQVPMGVKREGLTYSFRSARFRDRHRTVIVATYRLKGQ